MMRNTIATAVVALIGNVQGVQLWVRPKSSPIPPEECTTCTSDLSPIAHLLYPSYDS